MDVVRDVPGYKTVLRTFLHHQIQQLVEQLCEYTDEETVVLSANLSDGTLSHLGSKTAKIFLEKENDIITRFLGFCLDSSNNSVAHQSKVQEPSNNKEQRTKGRQAKRKSKRSKRTRQIISQKTVTDMVNKDLERNAEIQPANVPNNPAPSLTEATCSPSSQTETLCVNNKIETAVTKTDDCMDFSVYKTEDDVDNFSDVSVEIDLKPSDENIDCDNIKVENGTELSTINSQEANIDSSTQPDVSTGQTKTLNKETSGLHIKEYSGSSVEIPEIILDDRRAMSVKLSRVDENKTSRTEATPVFQVQRGKNSIIKIQKVKSLTLFKPSSVEPNEEGKKINNVVAEGAKPRKSSLNKLDSRGFGHPLTYMKPKVEGTKINHICDQCGMGYASRFGLKSHVDSIHRNVFRFTCEKCGKGCQGLWNFRSHMRTHDNKRSEKCSQCPKTFTHVSSLRQHEKTHMAQFIARPVSSCKFCGVDCKDEKGRKEHERGAHGGKAYTCSTCLKTFKWRSSLSYHVKHSICNSQN